MNIVNCLSNFSEFIIYVNVIMIYIPKKSKILNVFLFKQFLACVTFFLACVQFCSGNVFFFEG